MASAMTVTTTTIMELPHDMVDERGQAVILPELNFPTMDHDTDIAPWDEPPSPPPKPTRSFGFSPKTSLTSFVVESTASLLNRNGHRPPDSFRSTLSVSDTIYGGSSSTLELPSSNQYTNQSSHDLRKAKSSMFSNLMKKRSKGRLRSGSDEPEVQSLRSVPPPLPEASASLGFSSRDYRKPSKRKKDSGGSKHTILGTLPPKEAELRLDLNFDDIDGIVNRSYAPLNGIPITTSPSSLSHQSGSYSSDSYSSHSLSGSSSLRPISQSEFHNPFPHVSQKTILPPRSSSIMASKELAAAGNLLNNHPHPKIQDRKISPKTIFSGYKVGSDAPGSATWDPPESWVVEKDGGIPEDEYSSSEDSVLGAVGTGGGRPLEFSHSPEDIFTFPGDNSGDPRQTKGVFRKTASLSSTSISTTTSGERKKGIGFPNNLIKRKKGRIPDLHNGSIGTKSSSISHRAVNRGNFTIRVYRENHTYHMVQVGFQVTVADLMPRLNAKLLLSEENESHRLYLKERGRERMLASTERPADIVRRRLEQAGYDPSDGMDIATGEAPLFLLKFVYKSQLVGPAEAELLIDTYDMVDLAGKGLRTIPVALHRQSDQIITLNLSRNPMLEIPMDFVQSCTMLRELRLSGMAVKKVPQSVHHFKSLHRLDISCNRIADLDDAYLGDIPALSTLHAQNNRMEKLPWYFPRLRSLVTLNISNNKFRSIPLVVCELGNLRDLDVSFNIITELPEQLGQLHSLERFVFVGNQVRTLPVECANLVNLQYLDCRRNHITDISIVCPLPRLQTLFADHNKLHALDLAIGPHLTMFDASHNEITRLCLLSGPPRHSYALQSLDLSHAQLSSLDELFLSQLSALRHLKLDHNVLQVIPNSLGDLHCLETLSCADNGLQELPASIGQLRKLEFLDVHANNLTELPKALWTCGSLKKINATSNLIAVIHNPHEYPTSISSGVESLKSSERKTSTSSLPPLPPLAYSIERLYLGENQLTDDVLHPLTILRHLKVLNLSFNVLNELPPTFFKNFGKIEELYLSGNKLTSIPTEDLAKLTKLSMLFLNGNRLQTLPQELGKVKSLTVIDVGSNQLRYNINNWEFDWNWNFNKNLRYLNLSGNKRLQIRSDVKGGSHRHSRDFISVGRQSLAGFTELHQLRVLGLMDVTITTTGMNASIDIPDETDERRVRTSLSTVNGMAYGIADTLGRNDLLSMLDLVHEFPGRKDEAVFAMFGRAEPPRGLTVTCSSNRLAKFLHDGFIDIFTRHLSTIREDRGEDATDALRRAFLALNQELYDHMFSQRVHRKMSAHSATSHDSSYDISVTRSGASGVVLYFQGKTLYVANAGNALAVVSRSGGAKLLSRRHDPYDREETARIRTAEGWISPPGLVNDEIDLSRSFGFFHLLPMLNARPDVTKWELSVLDEFVIIGNRGLWDFVSYQTAVDIARREGDPMIAAQKLRDFAISYGAQGSTMIMVIAVADLFKSEESRSRQPTLDSIVDPQLYIPHRPRDDIVDRGIRRLPGEIAAPTGHIALVFTDIRNSTHLWEVNPGMPTAMRLHNNLLRRQLRFCGGYEVKTEGDSFMCSFSSVFSALWWCMTVQEELVHEQWPLEITEAPDGKAMFDSQGRLVVKGLSVRMGIHCGTPFCEPDPITKRMDYVGPMVNRSSRIEGRAAGGEIMCSADVIAEIQAKILAKDADAESLEYLPAEAVEAINAIKRMGIVIVPVGEVKLKGLEVPEMLSCVYPSGLEGRQSIQEDADVSGSRIPFSVTQMQELGMMCLRLEALAMGRIFKQWPERKGSHALSVETDPEEEIETSMFLYGDPNVLLPPMSEKSSDVDMMLVMDSLSGRIDSAITSITRNPNAPSTKDVLASTLTRRGGLDDETLAIVLKVLQGL